VARPKKLERRDRQFNIAVTTCELERLHAAASDAAMRPADYARAKLFSDWLAGKKQAMSRRAATASHLDPLFMVALSRLGNNLNQIARRLNTLDMPAPPTLEPLLREIRRLVGSESRR